MDTMKAAVFQRHGGPEVLEVVRDHDRDPVLRQMAQGRGDKVEIIKFRRRKHSRTQAGHRQSYTEIEVTDIKA